MTLLRIDNLAVSYATRSGDVPAVLDVSLSIARGESIGLVGKVGVSQTTVAMAIMRHFGRSGRIVCGQILFDGEDITNRGAAAGTWAAARYRDGIPKSNMTLNPGLTIGEQLAEVPVYLADQSWDAGRARAAAMLRDVRLPDVAASWKRTRTNCPAASNSALSIAMALLAEPAVLLLDEPTTSLDVTIEAGVMD